MDLIKVSNLGSLGNGDWQISLEISAHSKKPFLFPFVWFGLKKTEQTTKLSKKKKKENWKEHFKVLTNKIENWKLLLVEYSTVDSNPRKDPVFLKLYSAIWTMSGWLAGLIKSNLQTFFETLHYVVQKSKYSGITLSRWNGVRQ